MTIAVMLPQEEPHTSLNPEELRQLLDAMVGPDQAAADRAFKRLVEVIWKTVWGMVRAKIEDFAADDVPQEAMLKILIYKPRWDESKGLDGFRSYLRIVVTSVRADYFRRLAGPRPKP